MRLLTRLMYGNAFNFSSKHIFILWIQRTSHWFCVFSEFIVFSLFVEGFNCLWFCKSDFCVLHSTFHAALVVFNMSWVVQMYFGLHRSTMFCLCRTQRMCVCGGGMLETGARVNEYFDSTPACLFVLWIKNLEDKLGHFQLLDLCLCISLGLITTLQLLNF